MATCLMVALGACQGAGSPSALPSADPTPTPPPPTADQVIVRFLALTGDPALTMHVVADGKVTVTGSDVAVEIGLGYPAKSQHESLRKIVTSAVS